MHICPRCRNRHEGQQPVCDYCKTVTRGAAGNEFTSMESVLDHIDDHRHENDWKGDGGWIE